MAEFSHETEGRRPIVVISLMLVLFVGAASLNKGMLQEEVGILVGLIWLASAVLLGWMVVANPKTGIKVTAKGVKWWDGDRSGFVPREKLQSFDVRDWSESTDYALLLKDGSKIGLNSLVDVDHGELAAALEKHNMVLTLR